MSVLVALMSKQMYTKVSAASFPVPFDFPTPMWLVLKPMIYLCHLLLKYCLFFCLLPSATKLRRLCFYRHLSTGGGGGGVCLSACWDTTPRSRHPPGADTPQSRPPGEQTQPPPGADTPQNRHLRRAETTPPQEQTPPSPRADTPPEADTPLEQTPPRSRHPPGVDTPPRDTATAADGTHPTGMHSCW